MNLKVIPNSQFFSVVENEIRSGGRLELRVKGTSMHPALVDERHRVVLAPLRREHLRVGMIALFGYKGRHMLHRLVAIDGDCLTFKGDNLPYTKEVVGEEDVIAFVEYIITPEGSVVDCKCWAFRTKARFLVFANRFARVPWCRVKGLCGRLSGVFRRRGSGPGGQRG